MDRRKHPRQARFLRLGFDWSSQRCLAVTTNVSTGGAFLNTAVLPPPGAQLDIAWAGGDGEPDVTFRGMVRRVVDPLSRISVVPGVGVAWLSARAPTSPHGLVRLLAPILGEVEVVADGDEAVWYPAAPMVAAPLCRIVKDLQRIDDLRPAVGETTEPCPPSQSQSGVEVVFYVSREPFSGRVRNLTRRGLWVDTEGPLPCVGDVTTGRYPIGGVEAPLTWARMVGVVVRAQHTGDTRGFAVEIISVDNSAGFERHVAALEQLPPPEPVVRRHRSAIRLVHSRGPIRRG